MKNISATLAQMNKLIIIVVKKLQIIIIIWSDTASTINQKNVKYSREKILLCFQWIN